MDLMTIDPNAQYQILGLVSGKEVRITSSFNHVGVSFKSLLGGNANGYIRQMDFAQNEAIGKMEKRAAKLGANAVIGIRIDSDSIGTPGTQSGDLESITVYGTAVEIQESN